MCISPVQRVFSSCDELCRLRPRIRIRYMHNASSIAQRTPKVIVANNTEAACIQWWILPRKIHINNDSRIMSDISNTNISSWKSTSSRLVEMFLSKKLAERERTGQRSRSKQGVSCPGFFLSIPVLNGLSDRSKPVQGFSHAVFHPFFSCFQPVLPVKPVQKLMRRLNYIIFDRDLTVFCQNPFNAVLRLCFSLSRGLFFPVKYLSSQICQSTLIERV